MVDLILKQFISANLHFDLQKIFIGFKNDILPNNNDPFIVLRYINTERITTAIQEVNSNLISELVRSNYQIDFYRDKNAELSTNFYLLISNGLNPIWGNFVNLSPPKNMTGILTEERYIARYILEVSITHYAKIEINTEFANKIDNIKIIPVREEI